MRGSKGVTIVELVLVVIVVAIIGALGYLYMTKSSQLADSQVQ